MKPHRFVEAGPPYRPGAVCGATERGKPAGYNMHGVRGVMVPALRCAKPEGDRIHRRLASSAGKEKP